MARILKNYTWEEKFGYPWDFWLNGETWEVTMQDASPSCSSLNNLYVAIYQAAQRRGLKIRSNKEGDKLIFQAFNPNAE